MTRSFFPIDGSTVSLGADTASDSVALYGPIEGEVQCRIYNSSSDTTAYVGFKNGSAGTITTATAMPVPPGDVEVVTLTNPARGPFNYAYAMTASGTATVYFTMGHGI